MEIIETPERLNKLLENKEGLLLYFSNDGCNVCKVLKPKVREMLEEQYPKMHMGYVDTERSPLLSGQHRVFTIPTILLFFMGKEQHRFSRNISLYQLEEAIAKPYGMIFE
ncbi:MAG: thioredoxin family protein [Bacteroidales bacterium]